MRRRSDIKDTDRLLPPEGFKGLKKIEKILEKVWKTRKETITSQSNPLRIMALDELLRRKIMLDRLRDLDGSPSPEAKSERSEYELRQDNEFLRDMIRDLQRQLEESNATNKRNSEQLVKLYDLIESDREEKQKP